MNVIEGNQKMTNDQIKELALAYGFKLKEQSDGNMDLNPYVYDFARALILSRDETLFYFISKYRDQMNLQRNDVKQAIDHCLDIIQEKSNEVEKRLIGSEYD